VQEKSNWPNPGPIDVASLPPIQSVINHGTSDPDQLLARKPEAAVVPTPQSDPSGQKVAENNRNAQPILLGSLKEGPEANQNPPATVALPAPINDSPPPAPEASSLPAPPPAELPPANNSGNIPQQSKSDPALTNPPLDASINQTTINTPKPTESQPSQPTNSTGSTANFGLGFDGLPATAVSAGRVAARVGKEVITVYDLNMAIQDWIRANVPQGQAIPERERIMMARMVLFQMIDRMLIVQEANRMMKSEKQKEALLKQIDSVWEDQQIPPLMKKYKVETKYDLDQAMRKQGRSVEAAKKEFINDALAHEFMGMKLGSKTYVSLVDMRRYYNENLASFDRPAQLIWREIRIPIENGKETEADAAVVKLIDELKKHSDFATLAKRESKGPTADQGGLWETSPGSFAVAEVNAALEKMQPGHVIGPIKAGSNYHILKLESKREAGPARFDEVQTQIQDKLRNEKLAAASMGFIQDLRKNTLIETIFDTLQPQQANSTGDQQVKPAQMQTGVPNTQPPAAPVASAQNQASTQQPVASSGQINSQANGMKGLKIGTGGKQLHFDMNNGQLDQSSPPPALAPSGPIPPKGIMSGPSQPSPL
jgi:parvulin-like peptidyl-prolyl isomerase